jgi:SsrA-binding protein
MIKNKKAFHDYTFLEKIEAGIVLKGSEVKSLREGRANLRDSFGRIEKQGVFLYNFRISPYPASFDKHPPLRKKKLLLNKGEIKRLNRKVQEKGLTIIPLQVYFNNRGIAKAEIALAKGKKTFDKRRVLKEKEVKRQIERNIKDRGAK